MLVSARHVSERQGMRAILIKKKTNLKMKPTLNSMPILSFWSVKMPAKIETGHCVQVPHAISV